MDAPPALAALTNSPSRLVIPLSPRAKTSELPSLSSPTSPLDSQQHQERIDAAIHDENAPSMLLDFVARSSKFEPRLRRYARRKLLSSSSSHSSTRRPVEPITAFTNVAGTSTSPTPVHMAAQPFSSSSAAATTDDRKNENTSTDSDKPLPPRNRHRLGAFSLVDVERALLSLTPHWWRKSSSSPSESASRDAHTEEDTSKFDLDLSGVLDDSFGSYAPHTPGATDTDHASQMPTDKGSRLFLDYYSSEDMVDILTRSGIISALARLGYANPSLIFDTSDDLQHRMSLVDSSLFDSTMSHLRSTERFLVDLYMKRRSAWTAESMVAYQLMKRLTKAGGWDGLREMTGELRAPYIPVEGAAEVAQFLELNVAKYSRSAKGGSCKWEVTEIVWMQSHDPRSKDARPLLPGQRFPGLGLARVIGETMERMSVESSVTDGLLNFPFYFHLAVAYSSRGWRHVDPAMEAYVEFVTRQVESSIKQHGLAFVAWAISLGHLRRKTEEYNPDSDSWHVVRERLERWTPAEQLYPTSTGVRDFLFGPEYTALYKKWTTLYAANGGAMATTEPKQDQPKLRASLYIDMEACPELWHYSTDTRWASRNPETGEFP
ncbi:hypothetical protein OIV83_006349 [Microbotryomycetes sp. JL201]|nr:hypothetical protein OIV83_006349 [Microbotryomycetes sp. JL201]